MIRTLLVALCLLLLLLLLGPIGLAAAWLARSPRPLYALAFPAVRLLLWIAGVRFRVEGRERLDPERTYLFVANHASNVDPPILLLAIGRDIKVIAKASLFRLPLFGWLLRVAGMVPVHRDDRERAIGAVELAAASLASGNDFLVFAEGTRSRDGRLLPLKKGPFVMAIKAGVPVVPVVLSGTREMMPKGTRRLRPGEARVRFLPPVSTRGLTFADRDVLRARVEAEMRRALGEPAGPAPADCNAPGASLP